MNLSLLNSKTSILLHSAQYTLYMAPFETKITYLKNVFNIYENKDVHWGLGHRLAGTANNFHRVGKDPEIKVFFYILGQNQVENIPPPILQTQSEDLNFPWLQLLSLAILVITTKIKN